jgi:hypothetical protein
MFAAITSYRNPHSRSPTLVRNAPVESDGKLALTKVYVGLQRNRSKNAHIDIGRNGRN